MSCVFHTHTQIVKAKLTNFFFTFSSLHNEVDFGSNMRWIKYLLAATMLSWCFVLRHISNGSLGNVKETPLQIKRPKHVFASTQEFNFTPKAYAFHIIIDNPAPPPHLLTSEAHTGISLTNQGIGWNTNGIKEG